MAPQEFSETAARTSLIFGGMGTDFTPRVGDHGTCVMSKMWGKLYGISNNIGDPVFAQLGGGANEADFLDTVSKIGDDVVLRRATGELGATQLVVVNIPLGISTATEYRGWTNRLRYLLQRMVNEGVFFVVAAGNDGEVSLPLPQHSLSFLTGFLEFCYRLSSRIRRS
jgi:hypothetical protein